MTATVPARKDIAEFFRLGLVAGICEPSSIARWADSIVAAEPSPHIAFIELCVAGSQPASSVQTLLGAVPGQTTRDLPFRMLLGHSSRLLAAHNFTAEQLLLRLYDLARLESLHEGIYGDLSGFEDELSLARDGVFGTVADVAQHFTRFLADYEPYAPDNSTGIA
jgi:hypothetical protein